MSLRALVDMLSASNVSAARAESDNWDETARTLSATVDALYGIKASLASSKETEWVERADERLNQIQQAANSYRRRAKLMSFHADALAVVTTAETKAAEFADAVATPMPPRMRRGFDALYLSSFAPRASASLATTIPMFTELLPNLNTLPALPVSVHELGDPDAPSYEQSPQPEPFRAYYETFGFKDVANATTPTEIIDAIGDINPDVIEAIKAGATQTQAAAVAAPNMPPTLTPGMPNSALPNPNTLTGGAGLPGNLGQGAGVGAFGAPGAAASGRGVSGPRAGSGMISGAAGNNQRPGSPIGAGAASGGAARAGAANGPVKGIRQNAGAVSGGSQSGRASGLPGGAGAGASGGMRPGAGLAPGAGLGAGAGRFGGAGGFGGGGSLGGGSLPGGPGAGPGAGPNAGPNAGPSYGASANNGTNGAGQRPAPGGAPMAYGAGGGPAGNGGQKRNSGKVQAVTSAVERNDNLRALLGEGPLVLPSVIGDNVRD